MKKLLLSLSALMIIGLSTLSAQLINPDFETWSNDPLVGAAAKQPNTGNPSSGWWDFNFVNSPFLNSSPITVFQGTASPAPEHGTYYAAIVSEKMVKSTYTTMKGYGFPYDTVNGVIITAYANVSIGGVTFKPGVPFTGGRISSFSFWYRYIPTGVDTASCSVGMAHFNSVTHTREYIGGGYWSTHTAQTTWTKVTVPVSYDSAVTLPDTILIQFSACATQSSVTPLVGDTFDIDNGSVPLGLDNITIQHDNVTLYPNPANSEVNLSVTGQFQATYVEVYDIAGKAMGTYPIRNNFLTINTQAYSSGLYIYKLLDESGVQLNVGKFSVAK